MAEILVGLTNNKTSFWDPNTKTYLTLANKTKAITFSETDPGIGKHLERICHGLFASNPAIRLYEGKIPEAAMNHWKAKFNLTGLDIAKNRADSLQAKSAVKETVVAKAIPKEAEKPTEKPTEQPTEPVVEEKVAARSNTRKKAVETEEK